MTDNKEDPTRHRGPLFRRYWVSTKISTAEETVNWSPWFLTEGPDCPVTRQARAPALCVGAKETDIDGHAVMGPGNTRRYNFFFHPLLCGRFFFMISHRKVDTRNSRAVLGRLRTDSGQGKERNGQAKAKGSSLVFFLATTAIQR